MGGACVDKCSESRFKSSTEEGLMGKGKRGVLLLGQCWEWKEGYGGPCEELTGGVCSLGRVI